MHDLILNSIQIYCTKSVETQLNLQGSQAKMWDDALWEISHIYYVKYVYSIAFNFCNCTLQCYCL